MARPGVALITGSSSHTSLSSPRPTCVKEPANRATEVPGIDAQFATTASARVSKHCRSAELCVIGRRDVARYRVLLGSAGSC